MPRGSKNDPTESGVLVYPKLPVPEQRARSEPRAPKRSGGGSKKLPLIAAAAAIAGLAAGFALRPVVLPDKRVERFKNEAAEAQAAAEIQKQRGDEAEKRAQASALKEKDALTELEAAKKIQSELAGKAKDAEKKAKDADAVQAKLK